MGHVFFDDSKHEQIGFCVAALAYTAEDPTSLVDTILMKHGLRPGIDEFKSSSYMTRYPEQAAIRAELRLVLHQHFRIGVAIVRDNAELSDGAFRLLEKATLHPDLIGGPHNVFFDREMTSATKARTVLAKTSVLNFCTIFHEQDSIVCRGIQVADLVAHTCGTMLRHRLGLTKPTDYSRETEDGFPFELGFYLWRDVRHAFLAEPPPGPETWSDAAPNILANVLPYGLYISDRVDPIVKEASHMEFGAMYLGCTR